MLLFKYEEEDRLVKRIAVQAAGIMQSSGNLKKSANTENLLDSIYSPLVDDQASARKADRKVIRDQDEAKKVVEGIQAKINKQ